MEILLECWSRGAWVVMVVVVVVAVAGVAVPARAVEFLHGREVSKLFS